MKFQFRVDANQNIGMGHFMRCLTLAREFKRLGHMVQFVSYGLHENALSLIKDEFEFFELKNLTSRDFLTETSVVLVDHYQLDISWHKKIKSQNHQLIVIDDLADKEILADIIFNQNINATIEAYKNKAKAKEFLIGPSYTLLRNEFSSPPSIVNKKYALILSMGGADGKNQTPRILRILEKLKYQNKILVLVGGTAKNLGELKSMKDKLSLDLEIKVNSQEVAKDLSNSSLCIGAGGISNLERAAIGIPTLVLATADNQVPSTLKLNEKGAVSYAGQWDGIEDIELANKIQDFLNDTTLHAQLIKNMSQIVDGKGANRTVNEIIEILSR